MGNKFLKSVFVSALISAVFCLAVVSCGGGGGDPAVDSIASVTPANGATNIPVTDAITVVFNKDIDETTLLPANITLKRANGVVNVAGEITYDEATKTMTFTPNFPLVGGALYSFTITTNVKTKAAAADYTITFTTAPSNLLYVTNENPADPATPLTSYNVWTMKSDGTSKTQLTTYTAGTSVSEDAPVWSPDYTMIAYSVAAAWEHDKPMNLYTMNADGTSKTAITSGTGNYGAYYPIWLKDGSRILYSFTLDNTASPTIYDIAAVDPSGSNFLNITNSTASNNVFPELPLDLSPLNTQFVYSSGLMSGTPKIDMQIRNVDGSGLAALTNLATNYMALGLFSPDATKVYYAVMSPTEAGGIYSVNPDGTGVQTLASFAAGNIARLLAVSPTGTKIAYLLSNLAASLTDLYILDIPTATSVVVTASAGSNVAGPASWSPDGSRLAYTFGNDGAGGTIDLYVINSDGTNPRNLTGYGADYFVDAPMGAFFPGHWSTDGTQIFFTNYHGLIYNIAAANADGSGVTAITNSTTTDYILGDWW